MKKLLVLGFLLLASSVFAQGFIISPMLGYTMTAFEDQDDAAGNILIGVEAGMMVMDNVEAGLEFVYPLGYVFEETFADEGFGGKFSTDFKNNMIGAYGKYYVDMDSFSPFVKVGIGYYMGNATTELELNDETKDMYEQLGLDPGDMEEDIEMDGAIGFNIGGGLLLNNGLFFQFDYNIVSRSAEGEDFGMNTWDILLGYQISFGD